MKSRNVTPMQIAKFGYIVLAVLFCAAGIALIAFPAPSAHTLAVGFGASMVVFGVIRLVGFFSRDLFRLAFQYDLQFGILLIVAGLITLIRPDGMLNFLCVSMGICTLADCLFRIKTALEARRFGIRQWWVTMVTAIITGVIGAVLAFRPSTAVDVIAVWLGICLLFDGILNLSVAISLVKIVRHQKPDVIDAEYFEELEDI